LTTIVAGLSIPRGPQKLHASVNIQSSPDSRQGDTEFDERDRDGRPHSHHDRFGIEYPCHSGDVPEHAAYE